MEIKDFFPKIIILVSPVRVTSLPDGDIHEFTMILFDKCRKILVFCLAGALLLTGCSKEDDVKSRNFRMGFTPFPYEISTQGVEYVYNKLETEADIINHHFDNGVPWPEALKGEDFDQKVIDDWTFRKSKAKPSHKTYVSVSPINFSRDGLAVYRGAEENMPLPAPWNSYSFNDEKVKTAYLNYCKRVIDFFHPDYFGMSIEANLLYVMNPQLWTDYLELHEYIYAQLKLLYPDLPVFTSVAGSPVLNGFLDSNSHDYVQQRLAMMQLLQFSDYYAISFYPHLIYRGVPYPENIFDELFSISSKPLIVAETGYTAQNFSMDMGQGIFPIGTDPAKQQKFVDDLLAASEKWKAKFVIYFTVRDYDQLWAQIGSPVDINIAWRDSGLYDEAGNPRPALNTWREYFKRKLED
ncbi:MAG: hypothetical protein WD824_06000 [Cyclobacteriaceae bacterium]